MSRWNYRVLADHNGCRLIECYYNDDDEIVAWANADALGADKEELAHDLALMVQALDRPTLTPADLPGGDQ